MTMSEKREFIHPASAKISSWSYLPKTSVTALCKVAMLALMG
jgi:hypothetical protein